MFKWIHHHFIPSEQNDHQPHFLRFRIVLGILGLIALLEATYLLSTSFVLPKSANFAAIFASVLVDQTNEKRAEDSIGTLVVNPKLELAARLKAEDMAAKGYFSHNSPDGKTPWYWFEQAEYKYAAAGENLAVNFTDSKDVTEAWMRSPTHRANILNGNYTEIGIGTAEGVYKGKTAIFVVQEFGRPSGVARQINTASSTNESLAGFITSPTVPITKPAPKAPTPVTPKPVIEFVTNNGSSIEEVVLVPTTTVVAGAEVKQLDIPQPESTFAETVVVEKKESSILEKIIASPHQTTTTIYVLLFALLTVALGLAVFIKIHIQHQHIILNGMIVLTAITLIIVINSILGLTQGVV